MRTSTRMTCTRAALVVGVSGAMTLPALVPAATAATPTVASRASTPQAASTWVAVIPDAKRPAAAMARAIAATRAAGGSVLRELPAIGQLVLRADAAEAGRLLASGAVRALTADARVRLSAVAYDPVTDSGSPVNVTKAVGARDLWSAGYSGDGIDIAVIDSGVTPLPGGPRLVIGPDLSFDSQDPATRRVDKYGHGTHLASIIAGEDQTSTSRTAADAQTGVAPDARVVSIKVGDVNGGVDVSQVVAAIDWAVQNRSNGLNLRVINLSFGTDSKQAWNLDPLAFAAESATRKGIVVVAAAGNTGGTGLDDPAYDPNVIAVGATDPMGTTNPVDDVVASYSNRGDGTRNPDLVAPGTGVIGLRLPGSVIDGETGGSGSRWLRGTGTSQAAAVVSGAVALLLQQRPSLTPAQVKALLRASAAPIAGESADEQGAGRLDLKRAMSMAVPAEAVAPRGTGTGSLDAARGSQVLILDGVALTGEKDVFGAAVDTSALAAATEGQTAWSGASFNGRAWTADSWTYLDEVKGSENTWGSAVLPTPLWSGLSLASWSGRSWSGRSWSGRSWSGRSWSGRYWSDKAFQPAAGTAPAAAGSISTSACGALPAWGAATVYNGGGSVTYAGRKWTARYWTRGNTPGDQTGVWGTSTAC